MTVPPIQPKRGIPQGGKLGPKLHKICLATALNKVWEQCQRERLGFDLETMYVPFLWFSDNCVILAHAAVDFQRIVTLIREALAPAGWRFPDDRVEFQANRHVLSSSLEALAAKFQSRGANQTIKLLGSMVNVVGNTTADFQHKLVLSRANLQKTS